MNAPFRDHEPPPVPFKSAATLRDAVLTTAPLDPNAFANETPNDRIENNLLSSGIEAMRQGRGFVFGRFDLDGEAYHTLSTAGAYAYAAEKLALPYAVFCGVAPLSIRDETRLTMIVGEAIDNVVGDDGADLGAAICVSGIQPMRHANGDIGFGWLGATMTVLPGGDELYARPIGPPPRGVLLQSPELPMRVMFAPTRQKPHHGAGI